MSVCWEIMLCLQEIEELTTLYIFEIEMNLQFDGYFNQMRLLVE